MTRKPKPRTKRADGAENLSVGKEIGLRFCKFPDGRVVYGPVWWEKLSKVIDSAIRRYASRAVAAERKRIGRVIEDAWSQVKDPDLMQLKNHILAAIRNPKVR